MQTAPSDFSKTLILDRVREIGSYSFTLLGTTYSIMAHVSELVNKTDGFERLDWEGSWAAESTTSDLTAPPKHP